MQQSQTRTDPQIVLVLLAFAAVYVVWGSTYLAIRFAIESLPPFLMAGIRFAAAGLLLYAIIRPRSVVPPTPANWKAAAIVGGLMLVGGNGLVCWAEQTVPSGWAALIIATVPLWLVVFDWLIHHGPRPTVRIIVGLVAGLGGVAMLIGTPAGGSARGHLLGGLALMAACVFWALGSLHSRRATLPSSPFMATAMQMTAGGALLLLLGTVSGEWSRVNFGVISLKSLLALGYLVFFGSILALTAYTWLLRVTTAARVSTYAYVNPVVAMFLGYALADEPLSMRVLIAAAVILGSVVVISTGKQRSSQEHAARQQSGGTTPTRAATVATQSGRSARGPA